MQQEQILREKVINWDKYFAAERAVVESVSYKTKNGQGLEVRKSVTNQTKKEGPPRKEDKWQMFKGSEFAELEKGKQEKNNQTKENTFLYKSHPNNL